MFCIYCSKKIRKGQLVTHVNIHRTPSVLSFCSKPCRKEYLDALNDKILKRVCVWSFGSLCYNIFFIRELINESIAPIFFIHKHGISRFSTDLTIINEQKLLELIEEQKQSSAT